MKVVHVINTLGGSGGAEHGLVREVTRFSPTVDQTVVRMFTKDQLGSELEKVGIPVVGLGLDSGRAGWNWPGAVSRLDSIVRQESPDVLHSSLFSSNLVAQLEGRLRRIPVLSTLTLSGRHDLLTRYQPGADSLRAEALRRVAAHAARGNRIWFRGLTRDAMATNAELLGVDPARVEVIPRGIPKDLIRSPLLSRQELGLPSNGSLLVNVGRQTAQKGHLTLLEAFERVRRYHDAHLVIVGREGEASGDIRNALAASRLSEHVTLTGYTASVHHYVAHASVFVFSSYMEGLGTSVLEALALGRPVVAFDIAPVREVTSNGEMAELITLGDTRAFADAVIRILDTPGNGSEARRSQVMRHFSIEMVAAKVEDLLTRVAGS